VVLVSSNKKGQYAAHCPPGKYYITVTKMGFVWYRETGSMRFEELTVEDVTIEYNVTLTSTEEITVSLL